jgi:hypothetical protein
MKIKMRTVKKNILRFFFIIVFVNAFWSCTKYETWVEEVKILRTEITEISDTTAVFTIVLGGNDWILDDVSIYFYYYPSGDNNIRFSWDKDYEYENDVYVKKRIVYIEGLVPGNNYGVKAGIHKDDLVVYSDIQYFTTEM